MNKLETARAAILSPLALAAQGAAPEWIMVMPAGPDLKAVDGRGWRLDDALAVASTSLNNGLPLPIDWEHGQDHLAPKGQRADAAGWIEELSVREGAVWARVTWTEEGAKAVASRSYRFISPAFLYGKVSPHPVSRIIGAALVNRPAFVMPALASEQPTLEDTMDKDLLDALGLAGNSTKADAIAAIAKLKDEKATALASAQTPPVDKFMPRADYDTVLQRATAAEKALAERDAADLEGKVKTLVEDAVRAGKISPASKEHYVGLAQKDFASVESLFKATPAILKPADLPKDTGKGAGALSDAERALCAQLGHTEEEFLKIRAEEEAA